MSAGGHGLGFASSGFRQPEPELELVDPSGQIGPVDPGEPRVGGTDLLGGEEAGFLPSLPRGVRFVVETFATPVSECGATGGFFVGVKKFNRIETSGQSSLSSAGFAVVSHHHWNPYLRRTWLLSPRSLTAIARWLLPLRMVYRGLEPSRAVAATGPASRPSTSRMGSPSTPTHAPTATVNRRCTAPGRSFRLSACAIGSGND